MRRKYRLISRISMKFSDSFSQLLSSWIKLISRSSAEPRSLSESEMRGPRSRESVPSVQTSVNFKRSRVRLPPIDRVEFASAFLVKKSSRETKISSTMWQFDVEEPIQSSSAKFVQGSQAQSVLQVYLQKKRAARWAGFWKQPARFGSLRWSSHLRETINVQVRRDGSIVIDGRWKSWCVSIVLHAPLVCRTLFPIVCCEFQPENSRKFDSKWINGYLWRTYSAAYFPSFPPKLRAYFRGFPCIFRIVFCFCMFCIALRMN